MKRTTIAFAAATLAALISAMSCGKEDIKEKYANQENRIASFVEKEMASNDTAVLTTRGGTTRLTIVPGSGDTLSKDGTISFYYAGYVMEGTSISASNMFATNRKETAESAAWNLSDTTVFKIETLNLGEKSLVEGLRNGLIGMRGGDEAYILFSGKHGFGKRQVGTIPANAALAYHVWVESISNE